MWATVDFCPSSTATVTPLETLLFQHTQPIPHGAYGFFFRVSLFYLRNERTDGSSEAALP